MLSGSRHLPTGSSPEAVERRVGSSCASESQGLSARWRATQVCFEGANFREYSRPAMRKLGLCSDLHHPSCVLEDGLDDTPCKPARAPGSLQEDSSTRIVRQALKHRRLRGDVSASQVFELQLQAQKTPGANPSKRSKPGKGS